MVTATAEQAIKSTTVPLGTETETFTNIKSKGKYVTVVAEWLKRH